jgi:glycogenin glucosyltransferase
VSAEKQAINKMCRYSKLHIWRFTRYKKIVFVDVDTLITQNIDSVFKWPQFSAVRDAGDTFNTGLFVLEPSLKTYKQMVDSYFSAPSYNQGDQGFINWFFRDHPKHALPVRYNVVAKLKHYAQWPIIRQQARMLHYTSETKPWTFFSGSHRSWRQNYDPLFFYLWSSTYRQLSKELKIDAHDPHRGHWFNANRVESVCEEAVKQVPLLSSLPDNQLTVVICKWRSIASLETALFHYRRIVNPIVSKIVISWNPSLGTPANELAKYKLVKDPPVQIVMHKFESVGNIFQPLPDLVTRAVFIADDEHLPDLERLEIALESWRNNPYSLVGFFGRFHGKQRIVEFDAEAARSNTTAAASHLPYNAISPFDQRYHWTYNMTSLKRPRPFSLLATPLLLLNAEYLFAYTCLLPERIHRFLDEQDDDGVDLAMNLMVSGMSANRPILVRSDLQDPELTKFYGGEGQVYMHSKGRLLQELAKMFAVTLHSRDPLLFNNVCVAQFNKIPFKKRSMKRWNDP